MVKIPLLSKVHKGILQWDEKYYYSTHMCTVHKSLCHVLMLLLVPSTPPFFVNSEY